MKLTTNSGSRPSIGRRIAAVVLVLATILALAPRVQAQENDALKILKTMTDYLTSQSSFSADFDVDIEAITPDLQKIQFTSSGKVILSRPNKMRAQRLGGYSDVELVFDGQMLTLVDKYKNVFAQVDMAGSVDQLIDHLRQDQGLEMPGGDLLLSKVYGELTSRVIDAKHIGRGIVDGVECEHLAFRNADIDWQIWIELGDRPVPRKYVITSKTLAAAPQYTLQIHKWTFEPALGADAFRFTPSEGAKKVALEELKGIDELPPEAATGGGQ